ncbi:MAG TPA: YggS family pyridoxal phosphate-dependent enzyme [Pusillimonas sp.]|nr:YggS family pyridoxal phosphate-dependent enzyme [Pusillimonas sp.]
MPFSFQERLSSIQTRISEACRRCNRTPAEVQLLPVSKTFDANAVRQVFSLGQHRFGENRVQEIRDKAPLLDDLPVEWVLIGHLQTNKAKDAAQLVTEVQSLDRLSLAQALDKRLKKLDKTLSVLIQIKTSPEPSKFGLEPSQLLSFLEELKAYPTLKPVGLMTLAVNSDNEEHVRACFRSLRALRDQAVQAGHHAVQRLSMGMSGDFEWAIEEGSTEVRIGSLLFGERE